MKILKLALLFLVLVGGLLAAFNWDTWFKTESVVVEEDSDFGDEDLIDISEQCDIIRKAWAAEKGWSAQLYKSQREDIDQSKSMGLFSRTGYETVHHCLFEEATNKACEGYMNALHAEKFSENELKTAFEGVKAIKAAEQQQNSPRIANIEKLHQLYVRISAFVKSKHGISPKFNTENGTWTSFASAQSGILSQARSMRNDPFFKEMSHLPGFKAGLDEQTLQKLTNGSRTSFYRSLSSQIVSHFRAADATQENLDLLGRVYQRYYGEEKTIGIDDLSALMVDLRRRLNN